MAKEKKRLTVASGAPVDDDQHAITVGPRGPVLIQDVHLAEKLAHFNRERIPERVVHAKGAGAHGIFECTADMSKYTRALFLSEKGKKTDVFARFSQVGGEKGSADAARDPRGFAIKFYTEDGNYDMTGNNTPVFFIRDPLKFPDFIHTQKRDPATNTPNPDMFWDFLSLTPESVHQVTILFSDRGTPLSYRHMHGFSSHTFKWYNAKGEFFWVKYHFKTLQGIQNLTREEAVRTAGENPDHATRDLFESIGRGEFPAWQVCVQIMPPEAAKTYRWNILDITKVWPHKDYPLIEIGTMTLTRNPENYFAEVEQSAFSPGNFVPGIGASPDKMLQARVVSYNDAHLYRLGANYQLLPINAPRACKAQNYQRDGFMRLDANGGGGPNYWPNSMGGPAPDLTAAEPPFDVEGLAARHPVEVTDDDFVQPGELYRRAMSDTDREHLVGNIVAHLGRALKRIQLRQAALFYKVDPDYGGRVTQGLKLDLAEVRRLAAMSQADRVKATSA
jgi:catalase